MTKKADALKQWLAEPENGLAALNYFVAGCCLAVGLLLDGMAGFIFAGIGTHTILWLRKVQRG